jgi:hypothetical protein
VNRAQRYPGDNPDDQAGSGGPITLFLTSIFSSEKKTVWLLVVSSLILVRFYFARGGLSWAGDGSFHLVYASIAARSLEHGDVPIWTNFFSSGSPYLQFYGFLFFLVTALVNLLVSDLQIALKLVLGASHVFSSVGVYCLVRILCRSRAAGFVGGLAYVLSFWHTQQVLIMGRLPLSLFYAILPWSFYFVELARIPARRVTSVVAGALSLGLLAFIHPGYAFWTMVFLGLYIAVRLSATKHDRRLVIGHGLLLGLGLMFGAFLTLPMWLERANTGLRSGFSLSHVPDPSWEQFVSWSNYRFLLVPLSEESHHWYGGYLGLSLILIALTGLVGILLSGTRRDRRSMLPAVGGLTLSVIFVFGYRWRMFQDLDVVQVFNAGRYLLFVVFFLAVLVGFGTHFLLRFKAKTDAPARLPLVLLVILVDLGPTTFQHPYIEEDTPPRLVDPIPDYRVLTVTGDVHGPLAHARLYWETGIPSVHGLFSESPLSLYQFLRPWVEVVSPVFNAVEELREVADRPEKEVVLGGIKLLNIGRVVVFRDQVGHSIPVGERLRSPVLVAPEITHYPQTAPPGPETEFPSVTALIEGMGIDLINNTCERIFILDHDGRSDLSTNPRVQVLEHSVWDQRVRIRVRVSSACYARLAYSYYPYLDVLLNNNRVEPLQTVGRYITLQLDAGEHVIALEPRLSPLRRILLVLDISLLLVGVLLIARERHIRRAA